MAEGNHVLSEVDRASFGSAGRVGSGAGRWAHGSLAVVVPVVPRDSHRLPSEPEVMWNLAGLFPTQKAVANPNEVTWERIVDQRISWALEPLEASSRYVAGRESPNRKDGRRKPLTLDELVAAARWAPGEAAVPLQLDSADQAQEAEDLADGADAAAEAGTDGAAEQTKPSAKSRSSEPAPLPPGCEVRAIEVLHYPNWDRADGLPTVRAAPDMDSFVVVHVWLSDEALADPGRIVAYFSRMTGNTDERTGYPAGSTEGNTKPLLAMRTSQWTAMLTKLGFEPIGAGRSLRAWRPFVISHLVPETSQLPASPFAASPGLERWDVAQAWAWRMGSGSRLSQGWEPGRGEEDAARHGTWLGSTWVRASSKALAFIGTRGVTEQGTQDAREGAAWWRDSFSNVEHTRAAAFAHRHAVWLAVLALRQSEKFQRHSEALTSGIVWPHQPPREGTAWDADESKDYRAATEVTATKALALQLALLRTRHRLWFTALPGREEETRLLRLLQASVGTEELLADIEVEQQQVTAALDQQALRVRTLAEKEAAALDQQALRLRTLAEKEAAADQESRDRTEATRDRNLNNLLSVLSLSVALVFVVDLALAIAQVRQGGDDWEGVGWAVGVSVPVAVVLALLLRWRIKRVNKGHA